MSYPNSLRLCQRKFCFWGWRVHECDLLVRSVQVHTSREERVCVCGGGETGRGLFLGGMWRINKCVRIKKKNDKKKKQTQKDDMTQPFFCFLRCHLSALLQRWRQLIVCTVSATSQQLQNRENNENVGTSHWNVTVKLQDDGMLQQCEHLVRRIWSLRQPYLSISPSLTLSL